MTNDEEKITHVAVRSPRTGKVLCLGPPYRHSDLLISTDSADSGELGFSTSSGRFVDRFDALQVAIAANQIKTSKDMRIQLLYSEDLIDWPDLPDEETNYDK